MPRRDDLVAVRRHGRPAIATHAMVGLLTVAVAVTGLALLGAVPRGLLHVVGGHDAAATWHRRLSLTLIFALVATAVVAPRASWQFLHDVTRWRRADVGWPGAFARHARHPDRHPAPRHDGRFDPVQRLVFTLMTVMFVVLVVTGVALLVLPRSATGLLAGCVRVHKTTGWLFVALVGAHILAGSGVLPTHRRVGWAMVTGRVPIRVARLLWPAWTARHTSPSPLALTRNKHEKVLL